MGATSDLAALGVTRAFWQHVIVHFQLSQYCDAFAGSCLSASTTTWPIAGNQRAKAERRAIENVSSRQLIPHFGDGHGTPILDTGVNWVEMACEDDGLRVT